MRAGAAVAGRSAVSRSIGAEVVAILPKCTTPRRMRHRGGIRSNLNEEVKRQTAASHAEADRT